jgi:peroxiredoxin Q/BCP
MEVNLKKVGDKAPESLGLDQNGNVINIADFKGKKIVVYFYPQDDTPTCTKEACNLRDNYSILKKQGFEIIGVSSDTDKKHQKFIDKYSLPFPLIADIDRKTIEAFGVWGLKKFMGKIYDGIHRVTYVVDEKGIIERVFDKVESKAHAEQIIASYQ